MSVLGLLTCPNLLSRFISICDGWGFLYTIRSQASDVINFSHKKNKYPTVYLIYQSV